MKNYDVVIIGGGAAGLACAVTLAQNERLKLAVVDAGARLGKKLAATGNGQGNISNLDMSASHYHGTAKALAEELCRDPYSGCELFDFLTVADERGRIYPSGRQASAISDELIKKISGKADIYLSNKVKEVYGDFNVILSDNTALFSKCIVLCTGGKAQKQFKTDGSAYSFAERFGHTVTELYPSIVQLKTKTEHIKGLSGIRADCSVKALYKGELLSSYRGDVIFTDYGVSGNAIFYLSSYLAERKGGELSIEFLPDFSEEEIRASVEKRISEENCLSGTLHNKLGQAIVKRAREEKRDVVEVLKNFTLPVEGTLGFDYAQVTRGGIRGDEVTSGLESKLKKNLYFAGEILDIDGDCGGYNLHWAFVSGIAAAKSILKSL